MKIEDSMLEFLISFHRGCREYSREKRSVKGKYTKNKCSLSDYFPDRKDHSPLFGSMHSHSVSPLLKSNHLIRTPKPEPLRNERVIEFEDGQQSIIDLDLLYGEEPKTDIPGFDRAHKEIFKQILVDLIDLSLNEYNIHYICHSEADLGFPFTSLCKKISEQFKLFYTYSIEKMPFGLWKQVTAEHYQILINSLPLWLKKELIDYRTKFTKKYVRSRIERNLKEFYKKNQHVKPKEECKYQVFSTQASDNDPTILTEDEYTEIIVSDVMKTPFHDFLHEQLESINTKKNLVLSFMAYIKSNEPEIISAFNETFYINKEFYKHLTLKNRWIENYKRPRGFPLKLGENERYLFSFDSDITFEQLKKMKVDRDKMENQPKSHVIKRKGDYCSEDSFFDSCDDEMESVNTLENLKPIKKKPTLKPIDNGKQQTFIQPLFLETFVGCPCFLIQIFKFLQTYCIILFSIRIFASKSFTAYLLKFLLSRKFTNG
jgi:hypothetical protein